jgi:hypothetical protein
MIAVVAGCFIIAIADANFSDNNTKQTKKTYKTGW